jgi:quercetin dioxygenase-like cupin family protein
MLHQATDTSRAARLPIPQDAWQLFAFHNLEIIRLDLQPGDSIPLHGNSLRIVFYLLAGSGSLRIEEDLFELQAGQSIAVKAGAMRSWVNTGSSTLNLLVIKSPDET